MMLPRHSHALCGVPRPAFRSITWPTTCQRLGSISWRVARLLGTRPPVFLPETVVHLYATCGTLACRVTGREPILTAHAVRLITTPKALSNTRLKARAGVRAALPQIFRRTGGSISWLII